MRILQPYMFIRPSTSIRNTRVLHMSYYLISKSFLNLSGVELAILLLQTKVILGYTNEQIYVAEPMTNVQSNLDHSSMGLASSMQDFTQVIFNQIPKMFFKYCRKYVNYMNFMKLQYLIVSVMKHSKAVLKWMVATKVD
jgi:hypothetical protein